MNRLSVRLRVTLAATVIVATVLTAASLVLILTLRDSLEGGVADEATRKVRADAAALKEDPILTAPPGEDGGASSTPPKSGHGAGTGGEKVVMAGGYATASKVVDTVDGPVTVKARVSLAPVRNALDTLEQLLLVGVPALVVLMAVMTWQLMGRVLAPVESIRATFADITAKNLHRRVPEPVTRDEVARLARTMNVTLGQLESAVDRHKQFVADAAHELRNPVATLSARLELGMTQAPDLVTEALTDVARIKELTGDLLLLARLDGGEPLMGADVDLAQVAAEAAARPAPVKIVLELESDVIVTGTRSHLERMVANLVANAVRHAASRITIKVTADGLDVIDDGPGIPAASRERVFQRFHRLDEARARDAGGSGLGLAIARDIATAHGGTLTVQDTPHGAHLSFRITGAGRTEHVHP
ncbi:MULTISPECIES: sensor histidine kinase [Streptomyces]|uniref:histidine kinase n=1 Tax=Streptomyces scabiei (strain 87.22) TaxID=680198 RepID=C9ZEM5_STRSW|nr:MULTISPECIES: HAMP domain-containing sensor histidine kinase [Streptomyces]MBP5859261.1 HAMP domain-containing histidine kinase [Streptomyces sp. LBUM 1484]MBP5910822.1 HAMP domain-containing histidine kinase [Streptomyces sp. LBUM 1478]MBP5934382.1 HAMP domain-containing histidine kinase [Streptomyces sp. LBUM 1479]KFG10043.1 histidine kinase [Streptomyces scabiei]MBP5880609.1 HAMP domain-containing histidine kinase [Streptomyces sp. LBUM 1477]